MDKTGTVMNIDSNRAIFGASGARRAGTVTGAIALVLAAIACLGPAPCHAESSAGQRAASARLDFRIVIPAIVRVKALEQPAGITVTKQDIAQDRKSVV